MSDPLQAFLGIKLIHVAAGIGGGLVRSLVDRRTSLTVRLSTTIVGGLFAAYLTPILVPFVSSWSGVRDASVEGAAGFLLGLCGLTLAEGIINKAKKWRENPKLPRLGE